MSELLCIHTGSRAAHACGCGSSPRHIYSKLYLCNTVYLRTRELQIVYTRIDYASVGLYINQCL